MNNKIGHKSTRRVSSCIHGRLVSRCIDCERRRLAFCRASDRATCEPDAIKAESRKDRKKTMGNGSRGKWRQRLGRRLVFKNKYIYSKSRCVRGKKKTNLPSLYPPPPPPPPPAPAPPLLLLVTTMTTSPNSTYSEVRQRKGKQHLTA